MRATRSAGGMRSERSEQSAATPDVPKRSLRRHHLERMKAKQLYPGDQDVLPRRVAERTLRRIHSH